VVRARPLHLDIRFSPQSKLDRVRLCSAEIQSIVIELYHRSKDLNHQITVIFEEGPMPRFLYKQERSELIPKLSELREETFKSFRDLDKGWEYGLRMENNPK
jgi:hypothetical protein